MGGILEGIKHFLVSQSEGEAPKLEGRQENNRHVMIFGASVSHQSKGAAAMLSAMWVAGASMCGPSTAQAQMAVAPSPPAKKLMARYASFVSHERSRLRICAALCLMAALLFVDAPCVALAGKVKITVTGVVASGIDVTGVFGPKNSDLAGKDYTQVFIVDDTKGTGTIVTAGNPPPASSIAASMGSNPVMATIKSAAVLFPMA